MRTHHSDLPSYYNSQEKQFLKKTLSRKSHCIMIKDKLIKLLSVMEIVRRKSTAKSRYLFLRKASS